MDPIAGLLSPDDRRRSRNMGLLAAGFSLMGGDEDLLSNIGNAGLMGVQAYMGSNERALEAQQLRQQQMAQLAQQQAKTRQEEQLRQIVGQIAQSGQFKSDAERQAFRARALADPGAAIEDYQESLRPDPIKVADGEALVAPDGTLIFENQEATNPWEGVNTDYSTAIVDTLGKPLEQVTTQELRDNAPAIRSTYQSMVEMRRSPGVTVNTGDREAGVREQSLGNQYKTIVDQATAATQTIGTLGQMQYLLNNGAATGTMQEVLLPARRLLASFGVEDDRLGPQETFNALSNQFALQLRSPDSGMGMPGAMSDRDREFLQASVPSLGKTPAGNAMLLDLMERTARRRLEVQQLADEYLDREGTLRGFNTWLAEWSRSNPLFPESVVGRYMGGG